MQPLRWDRRPNGLRAPAMVCAFKGWNDAGESASSALTFLGAGLGAQRFAVIDPEEFVDFQATRPTVKLAGGRQRAIEWPDIEIYEVRVPRAQRDLIILTGPEPAYRWRTFCETVIELAEAMGVQLVVTLGALLADVPHSRPVGVTAFATDDALVDRLNLEPPTYEGPTGIVGVLHDACTRSGMPSASLWAAVPHYVAVVPNPKGSLALLPDVPHSRPVGVTAFATDDALVDRLNLEPPTYEGPTGIVGVLHDACARGGMPSASLWAAVPHYVAVVPNPKGSLALLRRLESLVGITVDAKELEDAAAEYERQVSRAVEMDPDVQAFVERLERTADEEEGAPDPSTLPSGDVLAREFQRFLRQRGSGPEG